MLYGSGSGSVYGRRFGMGAPRQRASGRWQVEVCRSLHGRTIRRAGTFDTKRAAISWAAREEIAIEAELAKGGTAGATGQAESRTVAAMLDRYEREVSPGKRGARWEIIRLRRLARDPLGDVLLTDVGPPDIAAWRDRRLRDVSPASVLREMNLIVAVFNRAVKEWQWLAANPCTGVERPKEPPHRERRISDAEIARLAHSAGWALNDPAQLAETATQRVMAAALFAIETGMRDSEICRLTAADVNRETRVARLSLTKNGYGRDVPLSSAALALLDRLPAVPADKPLFGLTPALRDALWRKVRDKAAIADLHFHDTRHEATTRLAAKMDVLDLARMIGHRDIRMLMRYYHRSAAEVAAQLD